MSCQDSCRKEKLFKYRIKKSDRPFIDANLQIQIPGVESTAEKQGYSQVYSHYSLPTPSTLPTPPSLGEHLLTEMMAEAKRSYAVWKKKQQQLLEKSKVKK